MIASAALNSARRRHEVDALAAGGPVDMVVIGGGITGVGVALDAAVRGLRVALFERHDLAHGTSRWSSKLVHGGLRYLATGQVRVAWDSARERDILLRITAPHLVRASPCIIPLDDVLTRRRQAFVTAGTRLGAVMCHASGTPRGVMPWPRRISAGRARALMPTLCTDRLRGALLCWDGQLQDDARLVFAVARTAARYGAMIATRCAVTAVERGEVTVRDTIGDRVFTVRAPHVVGATGVWAGELDPSVRLSPSKGVHLIVPSPLLGNPRVAVTTPVPGEAGRWVFAVPTSAHHVMIGITDTPHRGPIPDIPVVDADDESYLLRTINRVLDTAINHDDVVGAFAGLRPLLAKTGKATSDLSRRHALIDDPRTGMVSVVGGKLTTYRRMAEDTVDHVAKRSSSSWPPSVTAALPLVGAAPSDALRSLPVPSRLIDRYGAEATDVMALARDDATLLEPIAAGIPVLGVELLFGMRNEGALDAPDLLDRRTRLGLIPAQRAAALRAVEAFVTGQSG